MAPAPAPVGVRLDALVTACLLSLAVGLAAELCWRWFAVRTMDLPSTLPALATPALLLNAVIPVLGNGLGYFMSYRRRLRRSLLLFVGPSAVLTGVGLAVSVAQVPTSSGWPALAVTTVFVLITPTVTVATLLSGRHVRRQRVRDGVPVGGT